MLTALLTVALLSRPVTMTVSWYGVRHHGKRTASGSKFNMYAHTCAHKTLPFGTWLRLEYKGRGSICEVTDRGPFVKGRDLDVSMRVAEDLGLGGVAPMQIEQLGLQE